MHLFTYLVAVANLVSVVPVTRNNKFFKHAYPYVQSITYFLDAFHRYNNINHKLIYIQYKCANPQNSIGNWQDASKSMCFKTFTLTNFTNIQFLTKCISPSVTTILCLSINFFYIMYHPVIVRGTNYLVLFNYFHFTVWFMTAASPDKILMSS